jgi:light-regulated signal transduction histidine kinase (bacteriophytochrome)
MDNLQVAIEDSKAEVTHEPLPTVVADEVQMVQIFQNMVANAIKFHDKEAPRVHVSAELKENEWLFSVKDNGMGIEPQYFDRIFIIFQRLNGQEYSGTGLGLSIVKKIIERHGGRVWVESEYGKGSTFYFTIPKRGGK